MRVANRSGYVPTIYAPPAAAPSVGATHARQLLGRLACPTCRGPLQLGRRGTVAVALGCDPCDAAYQVTNTVIDLRPPGRDSVEGDDEAWREHWSGEKQRTLVQRFFSLYRKTVFARTVGHFVNSYFPEGGVFVEAGSGTSETSMMVDACGGSRRLVALDLIPDVLEQCHPVMDVRLAGDIFRLPFLDDSLDGIWNVGVMEHFTHGQIDAILREFHRVLRPGARVILLWPGADSIPQKLLEGVAYFINLRRAPDAGRYCFHPPEVSRLRSVAHGRQVLARCGFETVTIDAGLYSLFAFKTVVGEKPALPRRDRRANGSQAHG